ncbi:MAG: DUF6291 domain-containing protein [Bacteroidia bacterium]
MKKSLILHIDSLEILDELSLEQKGILFNAIYQYHLGNEVDLDFAMKIAFLPFKNQFIRDSQKYSETTESNSYAGRLGNLKRWNNDLYKQVIDNVINIDEAEKIAQSRKVSQPIATATKVSQPIAIDRLNDSDSKNDSESKKISINDKDENFKNEIFSYSEIYSKDMLEKFYLHWSEKNSKQKMKFELEKTWETKKRLSKWHANSLKWDASKNNTKQIDGSKLINIE